MFQQLPLNKVEASSFLMSRFVSLSAQRGARSTLSESVHWLRGECPEDIVVGANELTLASAIEGCDGTQRASESSLKELIKLIHEVDSKDDVQEMDKVKMRALLIAASGSADS